MESELFGYEAGAFTGARAGGKPGKFELAQHGTIFLDEIGEMPLTMQVKLLRALQEHEITRVGGSRPIQLDFRLITATNRDLAAMMSEGSFREDLYYRINVIALTIPPLRERREDINVYASLFLEELGRQYGRTYRLSAEALDLLNRYYWPGQCAGAEKLHGARRRADPRRPGGRGPAARQDEKRRKRRSRSAPGPLQAAGAAGAHRAGGH